MDGRAFSDLYRNSSEEMFIRTLMESPVGLPAPTMEMLGFKNLSNNLRTDSEELFKSWLHNGENQGQNPIHNRPRQPSRRLLAVADQSSLSSHQNGFSLPRKKSNENMVPQSPLAVGESSSSLNEHSIRNVGERVSQASNLYLAKAWFHSSQPMTRSRSSELRRRYAAMQISQTAIGVEAMQNAAGHGDDQLKQEFGNPSAFNEPNQFNGFMPPLNSSSATFNVQQAGTVDKVSSVVSMLKGTLERKKLSNQVDKYDVVDSCLGYYRAQEASTFTNPDQGHETHMHEAQGTFQDLSAADMKDSVLLQTVQGSINVDLEHFVTPTNNPIQMSTTSREPSQSESSAAAPLISTCDGPSNSGQTVSFSDGSKKQIGNGKGLENGCAAEGTEIRGRTYDNLKEDLKQKRSLVRYGSVTSAASVDRGDPTKKRRVERSRKMAEAKERTQTPAIPSDMQSILKRCENLEKEVRSLKLNLSFMNRKDSEQTKQIEELQAQNEEMRVEKERLLEEIERILAEQEKM